MANRCVSDKVGGFRELRTFDGLQQNQLMIYARELGEHLRNERSLRAELSERERQVRLVMAASISAQEEERQWIAFEVHDRVAQTLAAAFHVIQGLEQAAKSDPPAYEATLRASSLVREAIRESRNIMNDLHPPGLAEHGLVPLIRDELRRFQEETRCRVKFLADCPERPSREVEVTLYRIFHEAVTNVKRHAEGARRLQVSLTCESHVVHLKIHDDGPGFDARAAQEGKRVGGLMSMRRRATIVGGSFDVSSATGKGTRLTISLPANGTRHKKEEAS